MIADKKIETVQTTTYTLTLTEKEMNTVMIAVGAIEPSDLRRQATALTLEVASSIQDNSELRALYYNLNRLVFQ